MNPRSARPAASPIPPYVYISVAGTALTFGGLYYWCMEEAPVTKRKRFIATSLQWEHQMGDEEYTRLLQHYKKDILPSDHRASVTVQRVGSRIASASRKFAQQHNLPYSSSEPTFTVVRSKDANAFVLPNHHIFVLTGIFEYVKDEDDLAAVLGHEMAHTALRHAGEKVSSNIVVSVLARLSLLIDPSGILFTFFGPAAALLRELPHSRTQESEADRIGIGLAAEACYDPRAAKRVFQNMSDGAGVASTGRTPPEFISTHPSHARRIADLELWMPEALRSYESDALHRCALIRREMKEARQAAARKAHRREHSFNQKRIR